MILLALVFFGLTALGCTLLAGGTATSRWWVSAAVIVALPAISFAVWQAARPPKGWPTTTTPPRQAQFQWGVVREPEPDNPGEIDLWLIPPGSEQPRAYRVPYTRQLHKQVQGATQAVKAGVRVGVRKVAKRGGANSKARFTFYRLPPPAPPSKD